MGFTSRSVAVVALLLWLFQNFAQGMIERHKTTLQQVLGAMVRRLEAGIHEVLEALLRRLEDMRHNRKQDGGRHLGAVGTVIAGDDRGGRLTDGRSSSGRSGNGHSGSFSASGGPRRGVANLRRQVWQKSGGDGTKPELWQAAEDGDIVAVTKLLRSGRRVDETYKGWSPLMKAAEEGHCEIVVALLKARADIEARNKNGRTPLSFAATPSMGRKASVAVVQLLLEAGASLEHKDARGETARDRAVRDGYRESVESIDAFVRQREVELEMANKIDAKIDAFVERRVQSFDGSPEALLAPGASSSLSTLRSTIASTTAASKALTLDVAEKEEDASSWSASSCSPPRTSTTLSEIECPEALSRSSLWSVQWTAQSPATSQSTSPVAPELQEKEPSVAQVKPQAVLQPSPKSPKQVPTSATVAPQSASLSAPMSTAGVPTVLAAVRKDVGWEVGKDMPISFVQESPLLARKITAQPRVGSRSSQSSLTPLPPLLSEKEEEDLYQI